MSIQSVINYIPLIGPERFFIDKTGLPNSYSDTNPSIYINENGFIKILIRQVNYKKFSNKSFVIGQKTSMSQYVMLTGYSFDKLETHFIEYDWNHFPKYPTYWEGMEDIRFITENKILVAVPERNSNGMPCIFLAEIISNSIKLLQKLEPSKTEKNWMPFHQNGESYVIYSVAPFVIKPLYEDNKRTICINDSLLRILQGYNGSTNGIAFEGSLLFLVHNYEIKSMHRWLKYDPITETVKVSEPFIFFIHSYIEFPCSICWYRNNIMVSFGINDDKAMLAIISPDNINFTE
jgi:hypothetical protein